MPALMAAVSAEASVGEIGDVFRGSFGQWDSPIDVL